MKRLFLLLIVPISLFALDERKAIHDHKRTTIYVTGALAPLNPEEVSLPYTLLKENEILQSFATTVTEALARHPGIRSTSFAPGANRPIIRGQTASRVKILSNGSDSGDLSFLSDDHAITVDPFSIARAEVVRGPATLLYGGSAIGGVVNLLDESIPEERIGRVVKGRISGELGNVADELRGGSAVIKGDADTLQWYLSSYYRRSGNIKVPGNLESDALMATEEHEEHGEDRNQLPNSDTLSKGATIGASHVTDWGFLGLSTKLFSSKYGVPGHLHHEEEHEEEEEVESEESHSPLNPSIDMNQVRVETRGEIKKPLSSLERLRLNLSVTQYEHDELEGKEIGTSFENSTLDGRLEVTHSKSDNFEGGGGLQLSYDDFKVSGEEAYLPPTRSFSPALFLSEVYHLTKSLDLQFGGRYEYVERTPLFTDLAKREFHPLSASSGLLWDVEDKLYTFGVTGAYTERAPNAAELYANGVHTATRSFEIGDPSLAKERAIGGELFFKKNSGNFTTSTNLFLQHYFNYLNFSPTAEVKDGVPVYVYNETESVLWGFENEVNLHLFESGAHTVDLISSLDFVRGRDTEKDTNLPRIPPFSARPGLRYDINGLGAGKLTTLLQSNFTDSQAKLATNELVTRSYITLDLTSSYTFPIQDKGLEGSVYISLQNLTDEEVRVHSSLTKDLYPLIGRALRGGFTLYF
jgi:iron complex outermembrane receptor protein